MKNNSNSLRNFEVKQKLGSGSYGVIFKAINKTDKSVCVLKQINLARMSERAKKNAVNEATIMGKLKHPFIVSYHESFTEDRNLNIIMQFCDGGDLSYYLKQQNKKYLKQTKIWMFFIQICMGLDYIHKNKILHRDIKTLNIFLHKNEMVKIGDLGVAKMLNSNDFAHTMVGTPFYLSPELCEEKPYNQKSDIWALGCLLYQLCTFRHPFQAANQASLILKIIRGKYSPIPEFYSAQLRQMIDLCLQRDYKRRPTAHMILSKPHVKKMIEEFQYQKIIDDFTRKSTQISLNIPKSMQSNQAIKKVNENNQILLKKPQKNENNEKNRPPSSQRPPQKPVPKVLDNVPLPPPRNTQPPLPPKRPIQKVIDEPKVISTQKKQIKSKQKPNQNLKKQQSQKKIKDTDDDKHKVLFGLDKQQNKAQFIHNLQQKMQKKGEQKSSKKSPAYFQIPWKNDHPRSQLQKKKSEDEDKIIIHNKNALFEKDIPIIPAKYSEPIQRIKMQKKIQAKVYEIKPADRPKGIIKSGGFNNNQPISQRKKSQSAARNPSHHQKNIVEKKQSQARKQPKAVTNSMRNLRKQPQQRQNYLGKKRDSNPGMIPHYPPRSKKNPITGEEPHRHSKPPKHLPHGKSASISRYTEVTRQEQQLVENLPDIVKTRNDSDSDEQVYQTQNKFKLNEVDNDIVLKKYEEMIDSNSQWKVKSTQNNDSNSDHGDQQKESDEKLEQEIDIQKSEQLLDQQQLVDEKQEPEQEQIENPDQYRQSEEFEQDVSGGDQHFYEVNKFSMGQQKVEGKHLWSYDEQPELPMMQQTETPFFEEANPYLIDEKTEQQNLQDKKLHLQLKLKQNLKRQDQINKLMQMKIEQCRSVVPKGFEQILVFFRSKINMDREYTDDDDREVEAFLSKRNLTDQRKFQNIYKIMHFEMELENTRRIIQSICKKLNQLEEM